MKRFLLLLLAAVLLTADSFAVSQQHGVYLYDPPHVFDFLTKIPGDLKDATKAAFRKDHIPLILIVTASTLILIWADQYLVDKAQNLGDHLGISHTNYQKTFFSTKVPFTNKSVGVEGPFDSGSALYFIGDGWVDVFVAGGFLTTGLVKNDNRALQTSSQIAESLLTSGAVVQTLKHITGRESPFTTQVPRGVWRFFPNQIRYARHVPEFDAFPSGHVAAATAVLTVVSENYPEYHYIKPVGYTLIGILGYQMLNNGVHWASDYPLALVLGHSFGMIAVRKGRRAKDERASLDILPYPMPGGAGVLALYHFGKQKGQG